jgi:uncharacterized membrane protein YciS (DUF1049 family)
MDIAILVLTGIGSLAAVVSAIFAFKTRIEIRNMENKIENKGNNSGVIFNKNKGRVKNENRRK